MPSVEHLISSAQSLGRYEPLGPLSAELSISQTKKEGASLPKARVDLLGEVRPQEWLSARRGVMAELRYLELAQGMHRGVAREHVDRFLAAAVEVSRSSLKGSLEQDLKQVLDLHGL